MPNIIVRAPWHLPEHRVTPQAAFHNRRAFLRRLGLGSAGLLAGATLTAAGATNKGYPYPRNGEFNPKWGLSNERVVSSYNNVYEFSLQKERVNKRIA